MLKVWLNGYSGQIGQAINKLLDPLQYEIFCTDKDELDITNVDSVMSFGEINRPDIIINCAGMTNVDECEENKEEAFRVNAIGARNLSIIAGKISAKLVHISTDDIFNGTKEKPFDEFDEPNPSTVYGKSKLAGERYVKEFTRKHFIIRSSWVYGYKENFVTKVIRTAKNGEVLKIANDQYGSPTSAHKLAQFILYIMNTNEYGTYHMTCLGVCSREEFAKEILKQCNIDGIIQSVSTKQADFTSKHPSYTVLHDLILRILNDYQAPTRQEALKDYLKEVK